MGYGTQKKVNLTGSIAAVGQEELKDRVNTDVLKAVQGTVPGVTIISRPGSDATINFRGRGNLGTSAHSEEQQFRLNYLPVIEQPRPS